MSELFFLNELPNQDIKAKPTYINDNTIIGSVNLFIKALNKVLFIIDESVNILAKIHNTQTSDRSLEDSKLFATFSENINLASKILDEFQKGTSILNDNTPEMIKLFTELKNAFSIARMKLSLFSITYDLKYTKDIKDIILNRLELFEEMKKVIITQSNSIK
jgi:hypothetical protein